MPLQNKLYNDFLREKYCDMVKMIARNVSAIVAANRTRFNFDGWMRVDSWSVDDWVGMDACGWMDGRMDGWMDTYRSIVFSVYFHGLVCFTSYHSALTLVKR